MPHLELRPNVLDNLRKTTGIASDRAMAGAIGVSEETYMRVKNGKQAPSAMFIAGLCQAFALGVGEVATLAIDDTYRNERKSA